MRGVSFLTMAIIIGFGEEIVPARIYSSESVAINPKTYIIGKDWTLIKEQRRMKRRHE